MWRRCNPAALLAIVAIAVLEAIALLRGVDGTLLAFSIAIIAGLGGYYVGRNRDGRG